MCNPEYTFAEVPGVRDEEPQAGRLEQSDQAGQTFDNQQSPPIRKPTTPPQITNMAAGQEVTDQRKPQDKSQPSRTLPPEPDTEFQVFIEDSLRLKLPIFGQNLFENVPSTFAPLDRVQVPPDYVIGPDDELLVRTWGQIDVNWRSIVDRSGAIFIPQIGNFSVAGIKYGDLHDYLKTLIGRIFRNFELSVSMGQLRSMQIFVVGEVRRPGTYTVSSLVTMIDALFASNGPSKHGSMRRIQLKRDGKTITTLDLYDLIVNGDKSKDVRLQPGDLIYVPPAGPLVALAGSISNPAIFELKDETTLGDVIRYAGGLDNTAAGDHAVVERIDNHQFRKSEKFPLDTEGLGRELHDGDVVRFLHISPRFEDTVTLRGNVAVPGRYPWHKGMKVHDLIPDRNFLITDEYWYRQNQLGGNARVLNSEPQNGQVPNPSLQVDLTVLKFDVIRIYADINWDYSVVQRFDFQNLSSHLLPFNLGKAIESDAEQNLALQSGDVITIFSQADIQVPIAEQTKFVHIEGEVARAGVYQVQSGETLHHLLTRIGGFTPQAYFFGAEFTRESTRVNQQERLDQYLIEQEEALDRSAG
ncbi:MAG: SLBB domain-containing protein, partial [Nitrososphaerales archaeon]